MIPIKGPEGELGVIVARFQTPVLTEGHHELIKTVQSRHSKFAIVLGTAKHIPSRKNPFDIQTRSLMIRKDYPHVNILSIGDLNSDEEWSADLDLAIRNFDSHARVVLYGGRDSFIPHYKGRFSTVELDSLITDSGTKFREKSFHLVRDSEDFRAGICYAVANRYPSCVPTVDIAIVMGKKVLLGRKHRESKYRFIGGFKDVRDASYEVAARREALEETNVSVGDLHYIGSTMIDDWRYRGTGDGITTIFFLGEYTGGIAKGADDIAMVQWFDIQEDMGKYIVDTHQPLVDLFLNYVRRNPRRND